MKVFEKNVRVEASAFAREGAEFFLQTNGANEVACSMHIHNTVELLYVKTGEYRVKLDSEEYEISAGDLILFCSNSIHNVFTKALPLNQYYVIKIHPSFFLDFSKKEIGSEYIMRFAVNSEKNKVIWRKEELEDSELLPILNMMIKEYEEQRYATEVAVRLKLMELLVAILRESNPKTELPSDQTVGIIYEIMTYVRGNYAQDMDERELAKNVGMSYSYFSRSFKSVSGMTFKKYLNRTRINKAEQLLHTSKDSITEIAMKCGFNNTSYFIKIYKSVTGDTPYSMRRQQKMKSLSKRDGQI